jgi:hypothetical protein
MRRSNSQVQHYGAGELKHLVRPTTCRPGHHLRRAPLRAPPLTDNYNPDTPLNWLCRILGVVNTRTKMLKRQMYGRAGFTLLRHRILLG